MTYTMLAHDAAVAAERAAESIRELNYVTSDICDSGGVCEVLGALASMAQQLPQSCALMTGWLEREAQSGLLRPQGGPPLQDAPTGLRLATDWLSRAGVLAEQLHQALACAHIAVGNLPHTNAFYQPELEPLPLQIRPTVPEQ
jgi:hypothetical protein